MGFVAWWYAWTHALLYTDWIIQYDPLDDPREYIQNGSYSKRRRCSRTGSLVPYTRRVGLPTLLKGAKVPLTEYDFPTNKIANVQSQLVVATSFGFSCPPKVTLNLDSNAAKFRKKNPAGRGGGKPEGRGSGHGFSANNPYGKKAARDKRQFTKL